MPYISEPYKNQNEASIIQRIRSSLIQVPIAETHGRSIDLAPWPERFDHAGSVHFRNNGRPEYTRLRGEKIRPDVVIFATGYRQTFPFFDTPEKSGSKSDSGISGVSDSESSEGIDVQMSSAEYPTPATVDTRNIWASRDPSIAFIGFVRPSFGAIPPLSELQAQLWVTKLAQPSLLPNVFDPADEPQYRLKSSREARIQYGVDHESYAYQLAVDMGAAPSLPEVISSGWRYSKAGNGAWYKLPLVWALGANFNAKFRLRGPWQWDGASEVLVDELWDTIARRGGFFGKCLTDLEMDDYQCV